MAYNSAALALGNEHEVKFRVYERDHFFYQLPDFPLRPETEPLVGNMDKLSQVAGQVQLGLTGVGENISCVLIRNTSFLCIGVSIGNSFHKLLVVSAIISFCDSRWNDKPKAVLRTISLTALSETTVPMPHELVRTGTGDTLDFEGEMNVFKD